MSKSRKKKKKKAEFPNDWAFYKKLKPKQFETCTFDELMDGLVNHWELLPGIQLVARAENKISGKVVERAFDSVPQINAFFKKIQKSGQPHYVFCFDQHQSFTAVFNDEA